MSEENSKNPSSSSENKAEVNDESREVNKEEVNDESKESEEEEEKDETGEDKQKEKSPIKPLTLGVLFLCILLLIWYLASNRHTPYSNHARLTALVVPIVPKVSGYLKGINIRLHSEVKENDILFQIDKELYQLAVASAEANVERTTQQMGLEGAAIKSAAGRLGMANAQLDRAQRNFDRVKAVVEDNPEALSLYDRDGAETALAAAIENVASAEADLEKARQQLGSYGPDNANLKMALTSFETAKLNLKYTTLKAPYHGVIESFNLDVGHYCSAGQPLATFISTKDVWIRADFPENSIENIKIGDKVSFHVDMTPGRVFKGTIRSVGFGVSSEQSQARGQLPSIVTKKGWLRPPQRFPVIISISEEDEAEVMKHFKLGGQVDAVIFTGSKKLLNAIARFRIWFNSKLSYVR